MSDKKRVDVALVERGLAQSREKAQALVMSGVVYIGENKVDKASTQVTPEQLADRIEEIAGDKESSHVG